jgi:polyribonucleotide nucleotidyltransferase
MLFKEVKHDLKSRVRNVLSKQEASPRSESAILARMGDTVITVNVNTAVPRQESDFFPLSVEYIEKFYASGKINGSRFVKREKFPSDDDILKARMIDRAIRPRFPKDYRNDLNLIVTVMSYDGECDPALLAINAASVALMYSSAPLMVLLRVSEWDG